MQIVEKKALPLYKMKLWSLELGCESVPAFSLAASILLVFPHFPGTLVSLSLTSLPRITQLLLKEIARRCVSLKELELSVVQRLSTDCCWACFEESSSCVEHSPIGSDASCSTAGDLAVDVLRWCLQPLVNLKRLSIGVFLSSPVILEEHIDNHSLAREDCQLIGCTLDDSFSAPHTPAVDGQVGRPRVYSYQKSAGGDVAIQEKGVTIGCRPYTPSKCSLCWEAHGLRTREDELIATMRLAQNLRSLESVRWSSWFNSAKTTPHQLELGRSLVNDSPGKDQSGGAELRDAQWATFEIRRGERRIKIWRRTVGRNGPSLEHRALRQISKRHPKGITGTKSGQQWLVQDNKRRMIVLWFGAKGDSKAQHLRYFDLSPHIMDSSPATPTTNDNPYEKSAEFARLYYFFEKLTQPRSRGGIPNQDQESMSRKTTADGLGTVPEDIAPLLKNLSAILTKDDPADGDHLETPMTALASTFAQSSSPPRSAHHPISDPVSTRPRRNTVAGPGPGDQTRPSTRTPVDQQRQSRRVQTRRFPLGEKHYPFTFKLLLHKLYDLEEWAAKVQGVLAASQEQFRSLSSSSHRPVAPAAGGLARPVLPGPPPPPRFLAHSLSPSPTRRRRAQSVLSKTKANDAAPTITTTRSGPASPKPKPSKPSQPSRAVKKRIVNRRRSTNGLGVGKMGEWMYDVAVSSTDADNADAKGNESVRRRKRVLSSVGFAEERRSVGCDVTNSSFYGCEHICALKSQHMMVGHGH
ncbi:hypothetical protein BJV74DRAFT_796597 [Russula compacta]|nr:hypothetical protein BJV74DRAFT_796597 [Russula compacta]